MRTGCGACRLPVVVHDDDDDDDDGSVVETSKSRWFKGTKIYTKNTQDATILTRRGRRAADRVCCCFKDRPMVPCRCVHG